MGPFGLKFSQMILHTETSKLMYNWSFLFVILYKPTLLPSTFKIFDKGGGLQSRFSLYDNNNNINWQKVLNCIGLWDLFIVVDVHWGHTHFPRFARITNSWKFLQVTLKTFRQTNKQKVTGNFLNLSYVAHIRGGFTQRCDHGISIWNEECSAFPH